MADNKVNEDKVTNPKAAVDPAPQVGGVTSNDEAVNTPHNIFDTKGSEPVRDREADPSKGTPVTRFFTTDGTPVEPSTVPPAQTPSNLAGFDPSKRDDIVAAVEYVDEGGNTITHDSLKSAKESGNKSNSKDNDGPTKK